LLVERVRHATPANNAPLLITAIHVTLPAPGR
jgi:hypothetical protein